jgi:SecD/SecF fusion protein
MSLTRQQLYDRIRETSKDSFVLEEMKRLGFWEDSPQPTVPEMLIKKEAELQKELNELVEKQRKYESREQMLKEMRAAKLKASKEKQAETKRRHEEQRKQKAGAWKVTQAENIVYLGEDVSKGLNFNTSDREKLQKYNLPYFENVKELAEKMGISLAQLRFLTFYRKVAKTTHYAQFSIPKKSGGTRQISAPKRKLKKAQKWLLENVLYKVENHQAVHGFVPKHSIKTNAEPHLAKAVVINLDLKDFFPSIHYKRVKGLFLKLGYSEQVAIIFALLCTQAEVEKVSVDGQIYYVQTGKRFLPQGSPASQTTAKTDAKSDSNSAKTDTANLAKKDSTPAQQGVSSLFAKMVRVPGIPDLVYEAGDTVAINKILNDDGVKNLLPNNLKFIWDVKPIQGDKNDNSGKSYYQLYAIKKGKGSKAPLGGEVITNARQGFDDRGRADISMSMNAEGARGWKKLTGANVNRRVAIVLDNFVYSAPVVQDEISGGQSSITGNFTIEEAKDLANILKAGKLPAPTRIVEEAVVGPSLGKESIQQGLTSVLVGFLLVVVFMAVYYASSGWVANAALMVNVFFIVGILAQLSASLTLPGIAGIVLTIGMAVDANVLIFERIREEQRSGKNLLESITMGFERAFWTIFDSNITTLLTAFFLYSFGTGPIKGFAITLMIGIICSFFTAVFVTRVIVEWIVAKKGNDSKLAFSIPFTKNLFTNMNFNYMGNRKLAYAISGAVIVVGFALIAFQGLNFGVDFKGGRTYIVEFKDKVVASDIRTALVDNFENKGTEVKTYDSDNKIKVTTVYMIDDDSDAADAKVLGALQAGLKDFANMNPQVLSSSKVGATIASDIRDSALWAVFTSLAAIFAYIVVRFRKWQFGLGAVIALFHDVLITFAMTAIVRNLGLPYEIDQVFVAAILTIIGYSINDTVVVFDRIREYLHDHTEKRTIDETLNAAISSTFSRTFMTAFTTFIVVFILFIAGGEVLKGFSFAMIVGLIFGTYSSIFIATAIVADTVSAEEYKKMEEENAAPVVTKTPAKGKTAKA